MSLTGAGSSKIPEVGADGKDGAAEATCPILVRDEAVAWRQKIGRPDLVGVLGGKNRRACVDATEFHVQVELVCRQSIGGRAAESVEGPSLAPMMVGEGLSGGFRRGRL